ncbi:hypothetical protein A3Q56_05499 [Intoshia linei]|uniref:Uncharacterized protein n=1 Tax=Intoshia linei TaxID=1819745 RepID=A0A177AXL4_9BILA|nr:hypothetical protein A3Q56_05499 [Intoshia linei]
MMNESLKNCESSREKLKSIVYFKNVNELNITRKIFPRNDINLNISKFRRKILLRVFLPVKSANIPTVKEKRETHSCLISLQNEHRQIRPSTSYLYRKHRINLDLKKSKPIFSKDSQIDHYIIDKNNFSREKFMNEDDITRRYGSRQNLLHNLMKKKQKKSDLSYNPRPTSAYTTSYKGIITPNLPISNNIYEHYDEIKTKKNLIKSNEKSYFKYFTNVKDLEEKIYKGEIVAPNHIQLHGSSNHFTGITSLAIAQDNKSFKNKIPQKVNQFSSKIEFQKEIHKKLLLKKQANFTYLPFCKKFLNPPIYWPDGFSYHDIKGIF